MAIFTSKKKTEAEEAVKPSTGAVRTGDSTSVIIRPRITEKATGHAAENVYVFDVILKANKKEIAHAVKELYKVSPVRVATVPVPAKKVFVRGRFGTKSAGKKAYVYLKDGDKIEFV
jgi:large subunit ribosomal protein L23